MSNNAPAQFPENELTRILERGGVGQVETPMVFGDQPRVRSAAMSRMPLTAEEKAELDAKAIALGVMPTEPGEEGSNYASRAEAEAAGAPVTSPDVGKVLYDAQFPPQDRLSAREVIGTTIQNFPRLPDFTKPGVLHLGLGVIYLDGLEFQIPAADLKEFRKYVVETVHQNLTARLNSALAAVLATGEEATDAATVETVQPVREDKDTGSVQPADSEQGRTSADVQELPEGGG